MISHMMRVNALVLFITIVVSITETRQALSDLPSDDGKVAPLNSTHVNATSSGIDNKSMGNTSSGSNSQLNEAASPETYSEKIKNALYENRDAVIRALIVIGTISGVILVYIFVRFLRQRRQRSKTKKYGLITMPDDQLEMRPLDDDDDDDEDLTVFDQTASLKKKNNKAKPTKPGAPKRKQ